MSKLWWVIIALAVVGGAVYFYSSNQSADVQEGAVMDQVELETEEPIVLEVVEISYTDEGFTPATVEVVAGTTVTFVNNSTQLMWVASDSHPTHDILPEFDQLEGVEAGGAFSYAFDEVGEWTYHNHLGPEHMGTIVVVEVEEEVVVEEEVSEEETTVEVETEVSVQ